MKKIKKNYIKKKPLAKKKVKKITNKKQKKNLKIKKNINNKFVIKFIDEYKIDGDYVESQAFAYIAIRSYLGLSNSFPGTTGCIKACTGGSIIKI